MVDAVGINNSFTSLRGKVSTSDLKFIENRLEEIDDKQGIFGKLCNSVKEITTLGVSMSDCEGMLDKYKKGEVSFEEAVEYINGYDSKQENAVGLLSNIITGQNNFRVN